MIAGAGRWQTVTPRLKNVVMWGAGDQGRVNLPILRSMGCTVVAFIDDTVGLVSPVSAIPVYRGIDAYKKDAHRFASLSLGFVIAIGNPTQSARCDLHDLLASNGMQPVSFADPSALICCSATLGDGLQAMPLAIVHNDAKIGRQCILNTRSLVEHDCVLEDGVELGPSATLCGRVYVGANTWIGAGVTVRQRIRIGNNSIVGAGAVVVSDIPDNTIVVGNPARPLAKRG